MTIPACCAVAALYSLQNPMMLTPLEPNAGPMGGAGLAFPASMASLITPVTFFAMHVATRRGLAVPRAEQRAEAVDEARLRVAIALLARPAAPLRTQSLASTPYAGHLEQEKCSVTSASRCNINQKNSIKKQHVLEFHVPEVLGTLSPLHVRARKCVSKRARAPPRWLYAAWHP